MRIPTNRLTDNPSPFSTFGCTDVGYACGSASGHMVRFGAEVSRPDLKDGLTHKTKAQPSRKTLFKLSAVLVAGWEVIVVFK